MWWLCIILLLLCPAASVHGEEGDGWGPSKLHENVHFGAPSLRQDLLSIESSKPHKPAAAGRYSPPLWLHTDPLQARRKLRARRWALRKPLVFIFVTHSCKMDGAPQPTQSEMHDWKVTTDATARATDTEAFLRVRRPLIFLFFLWCDKTSFPSAEPEGG